MFVNSFQNKILAVAQPCWLNFNLHFVVKIYLFLFLELLDVLFLYLFFAMFGGENIGEWNWHFYPKQILKGYISVHAIIWELNP